MAEPNAERQGSRCRKLRSSPAARSPQTPTAGASSCRSRGPTARLPAVHHEWHGQAYSSLASIANVLANSSDTYFHYRFIVRCLHEHRWETSGSDKENPMPQQNSPGQVMPEPKTRKDALL